VASIKILKRADNELTDACIWYEKQQLGLSQKFRKAIRNSLNSIALNPLIFPKRFEENLRFAILYKFPYVIVYWYDEKLDTVFVASVFHTKRNPDRLKSNE